MSNSTTSRFAPESAEALSGPDWLRGLRVAAAARARDEGPPSVEAEEWRYSRVGTLELDAYAVAGPAADRPEVEGHRVEDLGSGPDRSDLLGAAVGGHGDYFVDLNTAFCAAPVLIDIPPGSILDAPVVIGHTAPGPGCLSFPRVIIRAGTDSEVTIVELTRGQDGAVIPVTEVIVGAAARVRHLGVQELGRTSTQVARVASTVGQAGSLQLFHVALGGSYARMRFDCALSGRGASGRIGAVYLGGGDQMHDLRTFQDHLAPDTTSDLVFKGAVRDRAHAVYTGLIRISEGARGSNATQSNRIVKLSEETWAESVPNLEIHNNDVRCAHASAVGPVDPDQRFYLESRGVPPVVAERLVVEGFFGEVLDQLPVGAVAEEVRDRIHTELLGGRA